MQPERTSLAWIRTGLAAIGLSLFAGRTALVEADTALVMTLVAVLAVGLAAAITVGVIVAVRSSSAEGPARSRLITVTWLAVVLTGVMLAVTVAPL